ncbi:hypothetical protein HMPREF9628_01009 [Peptoanaerobacter stomatis]|uniref:TRAM domain-containing protein n=1 Tax=Peptoanaerobacter stomatis TaxID=796937 RepID=G9XAJ2_9FIRM|nr:PIN domain-containing protein [Peptoanaerobacter stomatis]EHL20012.1 hypothetical protein HMPREF9628_01009 [Peptoanaerobacter stomatis]
MIKKAIRWFIGIGGGSVGVLIYFLMYNILETVKPAYMSKSIFDVAMLTTLFILFGIIFYFIAPFLMKKSQQIANYIQNEVSKIPLPEMITTIFGFIISIVIAYFVTSPIKAIPFVGIPLTMAIYIFLGYIGSNIGRIKKDEIAKYIHSKRISSREKINKKTVNAMPKILDTSVIIDGRIADIIDTGFIEGKVIIPTFVLEELRHIADSADDLKRVKGRRGLDIINEIQNKSNVTVEVNETKFDVEYEVDIKLLKLAEKLGGSVVTNDYNLNKVAQIQNVKVLNVNELSNAVKPQLVSGEQINVQIVKEGKENSQGVAYLDDGTMIVVENGKKFVGSSIEVEVTSVLQTPAGRMIFAKTK